MYQQRLEQVRSLIAEWEVEGVLIGSPANRRWLSGFTGSNAWLLVTVDDCWLSTDFRYYEQAQKQASHFTLSKMETGDRTPAGMVQNSGISKIVFESDFMTMHMFQEIQRRTEKEISWYGKKLTLEPLRAIKSASELALIRKAAGIGDFAVSKMGELARPGITEQELAWELEKVMREVGADNVAFDVIVASGPNSALPHHLPSTRLLQVGDPIIIDIGAMVDGYRSDMTRSFFLGSEPPAEYLEIYSLVARAQAYALENMKPGMTSQAIDTLARNIIVNAGYGEHFGHGLGHGVGLDIHEEPRLSSTLVETLIPAGVVVTVEPGIYLPGRFGVRIEDLVVLHEDGPEFLSHAPKNPLLVTNS